MQATAGINHGRLGQVSSLQECAQRLGGIGLIGVGFTCATIKVKEKRAKERGIVSGTPRCGIFKRAQCEVRIDALGGMALSRRLHISKRLMKRLPYRA